MLIALMLVGCAYEAPPRPDAEPLDNVITGDVVLSGVAEPGDTYIFVFAADNPGPPAGTGSPVTFAAVPKEHFSPEVGGLYSASYSVYNLPDGEYILGALVDLDADFHFNFDAFKGSTCGDYTGSHVGDVQTLSSAPVTVAGGQLLEGVPVLVYNEIYMERPAFTLIEPTTASGSKVDNWASAADWGYGNPINVRELERKDIGSTSKGLLHVVPTGVHSGGVDPVAVEDDYELNDPGEECGVLMPLYGVDVANNTDQENGTNDNPGPDGKVDYHPLFYTPGGTQVYDVWPRMYMPYLGQTDDKGNLIIDPETGKGVTGLGDKERWVMLAAVNPLDVLFGLVPQTRVNEYYGLSDDYGHLGYGVEFLILPAALHELPDLDGDGLSDGDEVVTDTDQFPAGAYSFAMISQSGQTWLIPNEYGWNSFWADEGMAESNVLFESTSDSFDPSLQFSYLLLKD